MVETEETVLGRKIEQARSEACSENPNFKCGVRVTSLFSAHSVNLLRTLTVTLSPGSPQDLNETPGRITDVSDCGACAPLYVPPGSGRVRPWFSLPCAQRGDDRHCLSGAQTLALAATMSSSTPRFALRA